MASTPVLLPEFVSVPFRGRVRSKGMQACSMRTGMEEDAHELEHMQMYFEVSLGGWHSG